jgi:hypothetical protein
MFILGGAAWGPASEGSLEAIRRRTSVSFRAESLNTELWAGASMVVLAASVEEPATG